MRPLDFLGSIKLKLGVVIVAAVLVTGLVLPLGERVGLPPILTGLVAAALALGFVQLLAHGMTSPLREMARASRAMAQGDYHRRITATSRDEVGELARAFNTMVAELAEADRARRDFVANASHELRTPIGALRARLENLVDGIERADQPVLEELLNQVERLTELVHRLLDLSKLESGATPLAPSEMLAIDLLDRVAREWSARAAEEEVTLEVEGTPAELLIRADPLRLQQVLGNLVANAIRHSPAGGRVTLSAEPVGDEVRLEVRDEGTGIAPDELERVFERFYRSDRARSADDGGTGLGLAIARWIVDLHGGSIRAAQAEPHGCRMVVDLPR